MARRVPRLWRGAVPDTRPAVLRDLPPAGLMRCGGATGEAEMSTQSADFQLASRAFDLMTLAEREYVLKEFARLEYPSVIDRFMDAVHAVIVSRRLGPPICECTDSTPDGALCRACGGRLDTGESASQEPGR